MFRKPSLNIRVVSYNVLSSHLASPSHFTTLNPAHLEAAARIPVVLQKLDSELGTHRNVIVCLQEVSYDWLGKFHAYFANKGFHMTAVNYGRKFNGYMGKRAALLSILRWYLLPSLLAFFLDFRPHGSFSQASCWRGPARWRPFW
jgi:mRNA deadenylase 3'-5' endonuclease subunit Ccr4